MQSSHSYLYVIAPHATTGNVRHSVRRPRSSYTLDNRGKVSKVPLAKWPSGRADHSLGPSETGRPVRGDQVQSARLVAGAVREKPRTQRRILSANRRLEIGLAVPENIEAELWKRNARGADEKLHQFCDLVIVARPRVHDDRCETVGGRAPLLAQSLGGTKQRGGAGGERERVEQLRLRQNRRDECRALCDEGGNGAVGRDVCKGDNN